MQIRPLVLAALMSTALAASRLFADVAPAGPEFLVNTYTAGRQWSPAVASEGGGDFVIVWQSGTNYSYAISQDGSRAGIFGRRFDAAGAALSPEFAVNTYTTGPQFSPGVAAAAGGAFVVAWTGGSYSFQQDGSVAGAFVQRYDASGAPAGPEFLANTYTRHRQASPAVAVDGSGNFVVVWESGGYYYGVGQDGSGTGVFARRFAANGTPLGPELQVNSYTTGTQRLPAVAADPAGNFVVTWESGAYYSTQDGSGTGVFGQRFDATGARVGPEFRVNDFTSGDQERASVAMDGGGGFVVAWQSGYYSATQDGSGAAVLARRYAADGTPGGELIANTYTRGDQLDPAVAVDGAGNFVVVWTSESYPPQDGNGAGVFGQHFASTGLRLGPEFQVNAYTTGQQNVPAVGGDASGRFVVAWTTGSYGAGPDGSQSAVAARRFVTTATAPPALVPGTKLVLRDGAVGAQRALAVRGDAPAITLGGGDGSADDPTIHGGRVRVRIGAQSTTYVLPPYNWRHAGAPGANRGYVYRDRLLLDGPIQTAKIRPGGTVRVIGRGAGLSHALGSSPDPVLVVVQAGVAGARWCMSFGGITRFKPGLLYRAVRAPAPASCTL